MDSVPATVVEHVATDARVLEVYEARPTNGACRIDSPTQSGPSVLKYTTEAGWRLQKEATVSRYLTEQTTVPVPTVHAVDTIDGTEYTYLHTAVAPGHSLEDSIADQAVDDHSVMTTIGETLGRLHAQATFDRSGTIAPFRRPLTLTEAPDSWPAVLHDLLEAERTILADTAFADSVDDVIDALHTVTETITPVPDPVLLYSDPTPGNIYLEDGRIPALLDWEYAKIGDPVYDMTAVEHALIDYGPLAPDTRQSFLSGYRRHHQLPTDLAARRRVYRVVLPIGQMVSLCGGSEATDPDPAIADSPTGTRLRSTVQARLRTIEPL